MTEAKLIPAARIVRAEAYSSPRRMGGWLTAGAVVLSMVLATALPARAAPDGEDIAKTLLGLLIIGAIADSMDDNDGRGKPRPTPKPDKKKDRIPAACAIQIAGKRSEAIVYPERCLRDSGVTRRLPYHCASEARVYGRWDTVFSAQCLRDAGFRLDRRGKN